LGAYLSKSFVRERYAAFLFFLACILWGWGVIYEDRYKTKLTNAATTFVIIVFVANISYFTVREIRVRDGVSSLNKVLIEESKDGKTGFIIENPTLSYVHVREYGLEDKLIMINVYNQQVFKKRLIDKEFLLSEGESYDLQKEEIIKRLGSEGVNRYLYLMAIRNDKVSFDPERSIFDVLSKYCSEKIVMYPDSVTILYKFEECIFNK